MIHFPIIQCSKFANCLNCKKLIMPDKFKKTPEYFMCNSPQNNSYILMSGDGRQVGRMVAFKDYVYDSNIFYPIKSGYYSFYIKRLFIEPEFRNRGVGTALLNYAAKESYRQKCDGRVHLIAQNIINNGTPPQKFYRKFGFNSQNRQHIESIDRAIAYDEPLPKNRWTTPMYLPLTKPQDSKTVI